MKKSLFLLLGLMSLVGLSSCDDKFVYDEEKEFLPLGYLPKLPTSEDEDESVEPSVPVATTLQILGARGLVVDKIEKDDWKIVTPSDLTFKGTEPLQLEKQIFEFEDRIPKQIMDINTNYDPIPIAFGNTKVMYQYMGEDIELVPLEDVQLVVNVTEGGRGEGEYFMQYGDIEFLLMIGYVCVQKHKISFLIIDPLIADGSES